jgi:hypothetical protein
MDGETPMKNVILFAIVLASYFCVAQLVPQYRSLLQCHAIKNKADHNVVLTDDEIHQLVRCAYIDEKSVCHRTEEEGRKTSLNESQMQFLMMCDRTDARPVW